VGYQNLDPEKIVATAAQLKSRVAERFPNSGLSNVASELLIVTQQAQGQVNWISDPIYPLRIFVGLLVLGVIGVPAAMYFSLGRISTQFSSFGELIQTVEAGINDLVFIGIAIYFLLNIETRIKRKRALEALNRLRAMSHIIDMHQLTKDPDSLGATFSATQSSPPRIQDAASLVRYLDYCSEMLSIVSKIAAMYVQHFNDPVTLESINEIEELTNGLSRKMWQKIMIIKNI